ncbi:MAG TPA: maleylpyruvate isomerase family mycothiol-dependent enzyme [Actinocatenispora sp.]
MDTEQSWRVITAERLSLADLLDELTPDEWQEPSLCAGWRVRDVAAHIAMAPRVRLTRHLPDLIRARGSFNRFNREIAVRYAARPTALLVAEIRDNAGSRRLPAVTNHRNILLDMLVHGQDIAVPLGRDRPMPTAAAVSSAAHVWRMGWPFWARRRLRGYRLVATDADWDAGTGTEIRGPIAALLLLVAGRTAAAVPMLDGADALAPA